MFSLGFYCYDETPQPNSQFHITVHQEQGGQGPGGRSRRRGHRGLPFTGLLSLLSYRTPPAPGWQRFSTCGLQLLCQTFISIQNSSKTSYDVAVRIALWLGATTTCIKGLQHQEGWEPLV